MLVYAGRRSDQRLLVDILFLVSKLKENLLLTFSHGLLVFWWWKPKLLQDQTPPKSQQHQPLFMTPQEADKHLDPHWEQHIGHAGPPPVDRPAHLLAIRCDWHHRGCVCSPMGARGCEDNNHTPNTGDSGLQEGEESSTTQWGPPLDTQHHP